MTTPIVFDLIKPKEKLQFVLEKHNVKQIIPCQVHLAFDVSYSFRDEHAAGYTQQLLNRIVPFSMLFDKNQTLDSYAFSDCAEVLDDINLSNFNNYVNSHIRRSRCYDGGTNYLPIFRMLVESAGPTEICTPQPSIQIPVEKKASFFGKMFGKFDTVEIIEQKVPDIISLEQEKHLVFFVTDGEAFDQEEAKEYLDEILKTLSNPYFVFISIADREFNFFKDNYKDTTYSNYFNLTSNQLHNLQNSADEDLYEMIISPSLEQWMMRS